MNDLKCHVVVLVDHHLVQPRSQGSLLPALRSERGVGQVGENLRNEVAFVPLLWNLFQGDVTLLVKDTNLFMYANDHQLHVTWSDYNIVSSRLQNQGKLAMSWYRNRTLYLPTQRSFKVLLSIQEIVTQTKRLKPCRLKIRSLPTLRKSNYFELK